MECLKKNNQFIFKFAKDGRTLFYNNQNGKLALAKSIDLLEERFFEAAHDTMIDLEEVCYEQLYLAVSESCNFRCKYCRQKKSVKLENMSLEDIKYAIDTFYATSENPRSIIFFGGEPLMNIEGITYAVEYIRSFDHTIPFSMVINGSLCDRKIAKFFAENKIEVIVSLDGPEELHNKSRCFADGSGTYQKTIRGYHYLKEAGCVTGITAVIGPHNEDHFQELIDWAIKLQPNSLGFCLPHGDEDNFAMKISSFNEVHKKMIEAFDILHKNGIYLVQVEQKMNAFILGRAIPYECKACGKRIVACKERRFGICEGPITIHEKFYDSIEQLTACVKEYKKTSPFYISSCRSCIAYRTCGGSCVYDKLTRFGRADVRDKCRCGLNQMIAERAMEYILDHIPALEENHILTAEERKALNEEFSIG